VFFWLRRSRSSRCFSCWLGRDRRWTWWCDHQSPCIDAAAGGGGSSAGAAAGCEVVIPAFPMAAAAVAFMPAAVLPLLELFVREEVVENEAVEVVVVSAAVAVPVGVWFAVPVRTVARQF
jgi:hypothetical protein